MIIQWYPGHMVKAKRMLIDHLKLIDVVISLVDARAPYSTQNSDLDALCSGKDRIIILNKCDMADKACTQKWLEYFKSRGFLAMEFDSKADPRRKQAQDLILAAAKEKVERLKAKGISKTVRAMVVGIPNVGKSTFINCIAGAARTVVGDKPGVTKGKQWVKITPYLELMDTPGLLWPKLEDKNVAQNLAFIGSINDDIMDIEQLCTLLLERLNMLCPDALQSRYKAVSPELKGEELLKAVCRSRAFLLPGGEFDSERASRVVLDEFRAGKIARVCLESPEDIL